ncbi:MAG: polyprenyl synthetase family protein, partial [Candidatus Omnitrophota bacterium]|nr:polyprenyl synthetase family protein [Candidatus Omnitrophota bacterium]
MLGKIKNKIEKELVVYIRDLEKAYPLKRISGVLLRHIREFLLRKGKRIRPCLFVAGYLGFSKKRPPGLYRSAISLELLHDFMLVHDDIIDKSATRRGKPSMHAMLNKFLSRYQNIKFSGEDLTIVIGDVIYALALHAFLAIKEKPQRKENALKKLIEAALYTGSGEFIELLYAATPIDKIKKTDIYKIYDLKTATYTFAAPLTIGATLAGAAKNDLDKLFNYGIYVGRAFQIRDDIIGMFNEEKETGKSNLSDLREAKKTLLIWYAYNNSAEKNRIIMRRILSSRDAGKGELLKMRAILSASGALDFARRQISDSLKKAKKLIAASRM